MKIDIMNIDKFVEINGCPEVTNPVGLDVSRYPTNDGLFSNELFGLPGSYDRKTIFAYVDLKKNFLHPVVYKMLVSMNRKIEKLINGTLSFKIVAGELVEDPNGETGLKFLYENWSKLKFKETDSIKRGSKVSLIKLLKKEDAFVNKWLIIPAFYRDIDFSDSSSRVTQDPINEMYVRLLSLAASSDVNTGFDFMGTLTESRIQLLLVDIYVMLTQKLAKKNGYIHQYLMGKRVDYSVRSVISAPGINSNKWTDQRVPFAYVGIPIAMVCNLFFPFMVKEIQDFFSRELSTQNYIEYLSKDDNLPKKAYLKNPMEDFNAEGVKKLISIFIKSPENRFMPITINTEEGRMPISMFFSDIARSFTLTDLLYICAEEVVKDKHVYVARYPIAHHQNTFGARVKVLSTHETVYQKIKGKEYKNYPVVTPRKTPTGKSSFFDSLQPNNCYLEALDGDYDGDQVSVISLYTQEANNECDKNIFSIKNILNSNGDNIRVISKEAVLTFYCLTKD